MSDTTATLPDLFMLRAVKHFGHACDKHPYFADDLVIEYRDTSLEDTLGTLREVIEVREDYSLLAAENILNCEIAEMCVEIENKKTKRAIEEAYDAIAVLMRIICVLEGKQKLGQPKEGATK